MPITEHTGAQKKQYNIRITAELEKRLEELGRRLAITGNQFAAEALERYADILAEEMEAEDKAHKQASEEHRRLLRERLQSSRR